MYAPVAASWQDTKVECDAAATWSGAGYCKIQCGTGTYFSGNMADVNTCSNCHEFCSECTGGSYSQCSACDTNVFTFTNAPDSYCKRNCSSTQYNNSDDRYFSNSSKVYEISNSLKYCKCNHTGKIYRVGYWNVTEPNEGSPACSGNGTITSVNTDIANAVVNSNQTWVECSDMS